VVTRQIIQEAMNNVIGIFQLCPSALKGRILRESVAPAMSYNHFPDTCLNGHGKSCMEVCRICGHPLGENNDIPQSPVEILGDLFLKSFSSVDDSDMCPSCKKEHGLLSLMGLEK
jgi:hypothetical protein